MVIDIPLSRLSELPANVLRSLNPDNRSKNLDAAIAILGGPLIISAVHYLSNS